MSNCSSMHEVEIVDVSRLQLHICFIRRQPHSTVSFVIPLNFILSVNTYALGKN